MSPTASHSRLARAACAATIILAPAYVCFTTTDALAAVRFSGDAPVIRDLSTLRDQRALTVVVRNEASRAQKIDVSVDPPLSASGEPVPALSALFGSRISKVVDSHGRQAFSLPVVLPADARPPGGRFSATIVAQGRHDAAVERRLVVKVTDTEPPTDQGGALAADGLPDIAVPAVNFVPSLFSPLGPTLTMAGMVVLILAGIFWRRLGRIGRPAATIAGCALLGLGYASGTYGVPTVGNVTLALIIVAVALALLCAIGSFLKSRRVPVLSSFLWQRVLLAVAIAIFIVGALREASGARLDEQYKWHLVATKPVPLAADQSAGTVGVVADAESNVAELRASPHKLDVVGLVRAGTYSGNVDLRRGADGGEAKAIVTVRDWWPWALFVVAIGVGLGAWVRHHFEVRGPRDRATSQATRAERSIRKANAKWRVQAEGKPHAGYELVGRADKRLGAIRDLIAEGKSADAIAQIHALEAYAEAFSRARTRLLALDAIARRLEAAHSTHGFDVDSSSVEPLRRAATLLGEGTEFSERDAHADADTLAQLGENIEQLAKHVSETVDVHRLIVGYLTDADSRKEQPEDLRTRIGTLRKLGQQALLASSVEELAKIRRETINAGIAAGLNSEIESVPAADSTPPVSQPVPVTDEQLKAATVEILSEVYRSGSPTTSDRGYLGELFRFTAKLVGFEAGSILKVEWDFDELRVRVVEVVRIDSNGEGRAVTWHRFARAGDRDVKLRDGVRDKELAQARIQVQRARGRHDARGRAAARDREMTLLVGLVAVASGVLALYFADADWGQPKDYLEALLWGAVTAEGLKLLTDVIAKRLSGTT